MLHWPDVNEADVSNTSDCLILHVGRKPMFTNSWPLNVNINSFVQDVLTKLSIVHCRLKMLENEVVGGEQAKNTELKEKRKRRKTYADERKNQLAEALKHTDRDDPTILINVYESIQDEVRAKSKNIENLQRKVIFFFVIYP